MSYLRTLHSEHLKQVAVSHLATASGGNAYGSATNIQAAIIPLSTRQRVIYGGIEILVTHMMICEIVDDIREGDKVVVTDVSPIDGSTRTPEYRVHHVDRFEFGDAHIEAVLTKH